MREFLHVDDLAKACVFLINSTIYNHSLINIGSNEEISIKNLALLISRIANYEVEIKFDKNMPDGTPRKILDSSIINNLGWKPEISLEEGIKNIFLEC